MKFYVPCDRVARRFAWKDEEPFFEISSAQKFKYIEPGWNSLELSSSTLFFEIWSAKLDQFSGPVKTLRVSFPLCLGHVVNRTIPLPFCS